MEFTGRLVAVIPEQRGQSAKGAWVKGSFILESEDNFHTKLAVSFWGEDNLIRVRETPLNSLITVEFSIESREYKEKWYTECHMHKMTLAGQQQTQPRGQQQPPRQQVQYVTPPQMPQQQAPQQPQLQLELMQGDDNLPF
jgi:hypothetical protein